VKSAFIALPNISPVFEQTPEGISTETTRLLLLLILLNIFINIPLIFLVKPMPNKASTIRAFFFN